MIAHLRGVLLEKHPNQAIVEAGGVGYDVTVPISTFSALPDPGGESVFAFTRTCAKTRSPFTASSRRTRKRCLKNSLA